jgi:hypothetical protein
VIETIVTVIVSSTGGIAAKGAFDAWIARRNAVEKRVEVVSQADATVKTKRIENDADIRHELWERVEKLEQNQQSYLRENADLRVKIAERDAIIVQLTQEIHEARTQSEAAEKRAEAAEKMCEALANELDDVRRSFK